MGTLVYTMQNVLFLNVALIDIRRRNYQMQLLSNALEANFQEKDGITLRLPTLNFTHAETMTAWLEARKLVMNLGSRFRIRIQYYLGVYLALVWLGLLIVFLQISGYLEIKISLEHWISFGVVLAIISVYVFLILWPYSYINKQTQFQI